MMEFQKYDLIFVTTFVVKDAIDDLILSVTQSNNRINLLLLVVCQNGSLIEDLSSEHTAVKSLPVSHVLSLSAARNLAIKYIFEKRIEALHIMFPDDDSTFDSSFFERYQLFVSIDTNYIIDVYSTHTDALFKKLTHNSGRVFSRLNWGVACSVNMIISFNSLFKVGYFDEKLGVGARYGAGEDNDYFIRICNYSNGFVYCKQLHNFHPAPIQTYQQYSLKQLINRFNGYGRGVVFCLCKHHLFYDAFIVCLRAFLGGMKNLMFLKINYSIAYFLSFISRTFLFLSSILTRKL